MARFVLFTHTLCFDAGQQVFYPVNAPAQRVMLTPLQTAVLRRVLNAQGKLVRNQALHGLFQREQTEIPFAERLASTIVEINQLAQQAQAPGALILQVPLIGCVLAEQADAVPLNSDEEPAVVHTAPAAAPARIWRNPWLLRGGLAILLLLNLGLALLARQAYAPAGHEGTVYKAYGQEQQAQVFISQNLEPDSEVVQDALRRYRQWQPRLPDGTAASVIYINKARSRIFSSTFLCPRPITQKNNECMAWMVAVQELPDA